jgi:hypothetical protein
MATCIAGLHTRKNEDTTALPPWQWQWLSLVQLSLASPFAIALLQHDRAGSSALVTAASADKS